MEKKLSRPRIMLNPSNQYGNQIFDDDGKEVYNEAENMYLIACMVRDELECHGGVDVFMSRDSQTQKTTLKQETDLTRSLNCDFLFALHSDATGTDDPGGGTWTFFAEEEGHKAADRVHSNLIEAIRTFYPECRDKGVLTHWNRLWVLHEAGCPAILTEFLFHSNPTEREFLKDPKCQQIMAKAAAKGILEYLGLD